MFFFFFAAAVESIFSIHFAKNIILNNILMLLLNNKIKLVHYNIEIKF